MATETTATLMSVSRGKAAPKLSCRLTVRKGFNPGNKDWWKKSNNKGNSPLEAELRSLENDADRYKAHLQDLSSFRAKERLLNSLKRTYRSLVTLNEQRKDQGENLGNHNMKVAEGVLDTLQLQYAIVMAMRWKLFHQETMRYKRHKRIGAVLVELSFLGGICFEQMDPNLKNTAGAVGRSTGRHLKTQQKLKAVEADREDLFVTLMSQANKEELDGLDTGSVRSKSIKVTRRMLSTVIGGKEKAKWKKPSLEHIRLSVTPTAACNMPQPLPPEIEPLNPRDLRNKSGWQRKAGDAGTGSNTDESEGEETTTQDAVKLSWKKTKARTNRQRAHALDQQHNA